jgi:hypothetical protein
LAYIRLLCLLCECEQMKPDSRKDAMEMDACAQEEVGVVAEHDSKKDPACDVGKAAEGASDGTQKKVSNQDPFADNHELQEQPGAIKAAAALFQLCMLASISLTSPSRGWQLGC